MKQLFDVIQEKLILSKPLNKTNSIEKHIIVNTVSSLTDIIVERIKTNAIDIDLRDIDVSYMENLNNLGSRITTQARRHGISYDTLKSIETINVTGWDVSKIENFSGCFETMGAKEIIGLDTWDISSGIRFDRMFTYSKIENFDNICDWQFRTDKRLIMRDMFSYCQCNDRLDLSNWDVSAVTDMSNMFSFSHFIEIDLSNWNTNKVNHIYKMFSNCIELRRVIGFDKLDLSNIRDISYMFNKCEKLEDIGDLSNLDVSRIYNMELVFNQCIKLKLNLSKWKLNICGNYRKSFYKVDTKIFKKPHKPV